MGNVLTIILQRLALGLLTLLIVSIVIFVAVNLLPGNFAQAILGQGATPEAVAVIERDLGLDQPMVVRYFDWLSGVLRGDFGSSFAQANFASFSGTDSGATTVAQQIAPRFANTMFLAMVTALIAVPVSITLVILAAQETPETFLRMTLDKVWQGPIEVYCASDLLEGPEFGLN